MQDRPRYHALPDYSPAIDTPDYTPEPRPDEERVQISSRRVTRDETGVFVQKNKHFTLALTNQPQNCREPTYGRGSILQGALTLEKTEGILSVEAKLEGMIEVLVSSLSITQNTNIPLFTDEKLLFKRPDPPQASSESKRSTFSFTRSSSSQYPNIPPQICGEHCPSTLTFSLQFPNNYSYEGVSRPLPSTFSGLFGETPGLGTMFDVRYSLKIVIFRKGSLIGKKSSSTISIVYVPRSRPSRPTLPASLSFISTLKSSPEEWKAFEAEASPKEGHELGDTIYATLLIPQGQVYPLGHTIPFHISISCNSPKLLASFSLVGSQPEDLTSRSSAQASAANNRKDLLGGKISIVVQRQIAVEVMGDWIQLKQILSTAALRRCSFEASESSTHRPTVNSLAWEGQLDVPEHHKCAGFAGPGFRLTDHILLTVAPPDPVRSPLRQIHRLIPIRLTTDPYHEELTHSMEMAQLPVTD